MGIASTAVDIVTDGYDSFFGFAETAMVKSLDFLGELQAFEVPLLSINVQYEAPTATAPPFTLPAAPAAPPINFAIEAAPVAPAVGSIGGIVVGSAPTFSGTEPTIDLPSRPSPLDATPPGEAPTVGEIELPETPVLAYPDVPTLTEITLPDLPDIDYPEFTANLPVLDIDIPAVGITFSETPYSSLLLAETTSRIRLMLQGGTGLPAEVEQALFDRARVRLDVVAQKATQEAYEQWSARGFAEPGGELAARLREVREGNRDAANNLNRDILIRVHEVEIENLRFAVQQGIALENILITYYASYAQRQLEVQRLIAQVAIDVFNARIGLYNAALTGYRTQAEVFKALIDAERAKIELYRAQIEGAVAVSSLNESKVRIYAEQTRALQARVDIYEAQIRAVTAQVEIDKARVDAYRATVQAFAERVNAKKAEFEAYGEEARAQTSIVGAYEASVRAFAERTRAYSIGVEAKATSKKIELDSKRLEIEAFQAEVAAYREKVNAEVSKTQAALNLYDGQARIYTALLGAEGARVESTARQFQMEIENARNAATIAIQNATTNAENAIRAAGLTLESLKTQSTVAAQVAAGALSAVNLTASISGTGTAGQNVGVSYSVDGGSGPPPILGI